MALIIAILISVVCSWGITVGAVWLIAKCFGLSFSLLTATGIWLIVLVLRSIFK